MERRLALALALSALLVGGAAWSRIARRSNPFAALTVVNAAASGQDAAASDSTSMDAPDASTSAEDLTATDLIGRQYVTSYLSLAADGQATDANISALADNAAQNLTTLFTYTPITAGDLISTGDSSASFQAYGTAVQAIYDHYHSLTDAALKSVDLSDTTSPAFANTMGTLGGYYAHAAKELEALPAPQSLAALHLKLVNLYLSNASALSTMSKVNDDAASAYAALNAAAANSADETDTLLQIRSTLLTHGVTVTIGQ